MLSLHLLSLQSIPTLILVSLSIFGSSRCFSLTVPSTGTFLHAFVDSFQGCYKDGTEPGMFDCRWFAVLMLLLRPLLFIIYAFTLSMMYFVYAIILLIIYLIVKVNIRPLKKTSVCYDPSTDQVFLIMLSLRYATPLGKECYKKTISTTLV